MRELLDASEFKAVDITIPKPYLELTTRRVLTMQWIDGVKLTTLPPAEIRQLVKVSAYGRLHREGEAEAD